MKTENTSQENDDIGDIQVSDFLLQNRDDEDDNTPSVFTNDDDSSSDVEMAEDVTLNQSANSRPVQERSESADGRSDNSSALKQLQGYVHVYFHKLLAYFANVFVKVLVF